MKGLLHTLAALMVGGGVVLVIADFPFEARFPTAGPLAIGFGTMVLLVTFYLSRSKKGL